MAKIQKFDGDMDVLYTPKTKSRVYEYSGNTAANVDFKFEFPNEGWRYQNFAQRKGDDIIVTTFMVYGEDNPIIKTMKTTFKNYFAEGAPNLKIKFESYEAINPDPPVVYEITPDTTLGTQSYYGDGGETFITTAEGKVQTVTVDSPSNQYILNEKGNSTYNMKSDTSDFANGTTVYDLAGNDVFNLENQALYVVDYNGRDTYNFDGEISYLYTDDLQGNDTYNVAGSGHLNVEDYKGKDTYNLSGISSNFYLDEIQGSDAYNVSGSGNIGIFDYSGNEKYVIGSYTASESMIEDFCGNDKYFLNNVKRTLSFSINDYVGKDSWNISDVKGLTITDNAGKDKYTVSNIQSSTFADDLLIEDSAGNDTYNFTEVEQSFSQFMAIDGAGRDKYTLTDCYQTAINDRGIGNDKYTLLQCSEVNLYDESEGGKDSYTVKNCAGNIYLEDEGGSDKYNLTANEGVIIEDKGIFNDSYKINGLTAGTKITITDEGGNKDALTISGLSSKNLGLTFDLWHSDNGSIYLVDMSTGGYVKIENYYEQNDEFEFVGLASGCIEKVKAGITITSEMGLGYIDAVNYQKEELAGWLPEGGYTINQILDSGDMDVISKLIVSAGDISGMRNSWQH